MSKTKNAPRTELEKSLKRVDASDALAKVAAESQKPRVIIWESSPGVWSRYAVRENDLKLGFAESFDSAMKRAKNKFPGARIDHDPKMTDKAAKSLKTKFEAVVEAAGGTVQGKATSKPVIVPKGKKGKAPPKEETPGKEEQVADLLEELRNATDGDDKKRIRRKLRARGHYGGLGERTGPKPTTKATKAKKPKAEPDEDDIDVSDDDE